MFDPRTKLYCTILAVAGFSLTGRIPLLAAGLLLMLTGVLLLRMTKQYRSWILVILPTALFFGTVTWIAADGRQAAGAVLRIVAIGTSFFLFFQSTAPEDLADALRRTGLPYPFVFVLSASLSFVPTIRRMIGRIYDAQRSRGIPLKPGIRTISRYASFFIPLLVGSFRLSDQLAEALEIRGFDSPERTPADGFRFGLRDWILCSACTLLLILLLVLAG